MTKKILQLQKQINKQLRKGKKNKAKKVIILSLIVLLVAIVALGIVLFFNHGKNKTKIVSHTEYKDYDFTVSFLDVGEGNACLVVADGEAMLIDTGYYEYSQALRQDIEQLNIGKFKYVVASHPDADHIGSMGYILKNYSVDTVIMSDATNNTSSYNKMLEAIDEKNLKVDVPNCGDKYYLGRATIEVLSEKKEYKEVNDYSVVIKISYESKSFLIMGDASKLVEQEMLDKKANIKSDVILLGHHGSSDSTSEPFLKKVNPVDAVISCGKDNDYGHPHREIIELLNRRRINYYRTDEIGNITYGIKSGDATIYRLW